MLIRNILHYIKEAFLSIGRNGWMSLHPSLWLQFPYLSLVLFIWSTQCRAHYCGIGKPGGNNRRGGEDLTMRKSNNCASQLFNCRKWKKSVCFKAQALQRLKERMGEEWVEGYEDEERNPLPHSFEIRTIVPQDVPVVAGKLEKIPGIADVEYGAGVVEKLFRVGSVVRWIGLTFMVGLAVTAMFLIANTIKNRQCPLKEIMIMKWWGLQSGLSAGPLSLKVLFSV